MKAALLQYSPAWEDKYTNKQKIVSFLEGLEQVDLLVLPELTLSGFTMNAAKYSEELSGETFQFYSKLAGQYSINIIGGLIEKDSDNIYNTLVHVGSDGKLLARYRKIHPFSYSDEDKYYNRGFEPVVIEINGLKTGLTICYDLRFPELYRTYGKNKADMIINIANWPDTRIDHWRTLLKARAIENQCYIIGVNRVGDDPKLHYNGFSSVFDPMGKEIACCEDLERILIAEIDKNNVELVRKKFPFLNDIKLI
jgi:omega-amidase